MTTMAIATDGKDARRAAKRERRSLSRRAMIYRALIVVGFILVWQATAQLGLVDPRSASQPSDIAVAFVPMITDPTVIQALLDTAYVLLMAFLVGILLGMPLGLALALSPLFREAYMSIVIYLLGIPKTIFLPLFVLFFGLGNGSAIAFGAALAFLQIAINVVAGVDSIEPRYFTASRAFRASRVATFVHVILPGAAPAVFAGLWHGVRNAFVGVLIAQMFVSNIGIGYLVKIYSNNFQIDRAMVLIVISAVAVILLGALWETLETRMGRWQTAVRN